MSQSALTPLTTHKKDYEKPVLISKHEISRIRDVLPKNARQCHRLINHLAKKPNSPTNHVKRLCSIDNPSQVARTVNRYIYTLGYLVSCQKLSLYTNVWLWGVYALPPDDIYEVEPPNAQLPPDVGEIVARGSV